MSLFQQAQSTTTTSEYLVEFNAGKCIVENNWIKPDLRKGKIYLNQGDDQLLHLYWKERKNQANHEEDLIIFPDEAEFTRVSQCTTGRVYLLRFKSSNEHHFFWMQNKDEEKDQQIVERVNELIRDPSAASVTTPLDESASHAELMRLWTDVERQDPSITRDNIEQFLQSIGGRGATGESEATIDEEMADTTTNTADATDATETATTTTTTAATPATAPATETVATTTEQTSSAEQEATTASASASAPATTAAASSEQLDRLREILANVRPGGSNAPISLNDVLNTQTLTPLLNDPEICSSLFPYLPEESERSVDEVRQITKSPQFSQALSSLSVALQTGQLGPLLTQLGLDYSAGNSVESFLIAISEQAKKKKKDDMDTTE